MFDAVAGRTAATQAVRRWSGYILHPSLAQVFLNAPDNRRVSPSQEGLWYALDAAVLWDVALIVVMAGGFVCRANARETVRGDHGSCCAARFTL